MRRATIPSKSYTAESVAPILAKLKIKYGASSDAPLGNIDFNAGEVASFLNTTPRIGRMEAVILDYLRGRSFAKAVAEGDVRHRDLYVDTRRRHELSFFQDAQATLERWPSEIDLLAKHGVEGTTLVTDAFMSFMKQPSKVVDVLSYFKKSWRNIILDTFRKVGYMETDFKESEHEEHPDEESEVLMKEAAEDCPMDGVLDDDSSDAPVAAAPSDGSAGSEENYKRGKIGPKRIPARHIGHIDEAKRLTNEDEDDYDGGDFESCRVRELAATNPVLLWDVIIDTFYPEENSPCRNRLQAIAAMISRDKDMSVSKAARIIAGDTREKYMTVYSSYVRLCQKSADIFGTTKADSLMMKLLDTYSDPVKVEATMAKYQIDV